MEKKNAAQQLASLPPVRKIEDFYKTPGTNFVSSFISI